MSQQTSYETVIGLETHVQLRTKSKLFCGCSAAFAGKPNSQCCPVCMGLPGALPVINREAVRMAALTGLAVGARVHLHSRFDRKHYFYPDLPKGYQISQYFQPLCEGGEILIQTRTTTKSIGITRIHMEEDAGKLLHEETDGTLLDLNRCGVPLVEIVSRPELSSGEEAVAYLRKLRSILVYAGVSDCKMNEGSLRCDVNLSVRKHGQPLGVRTEIKNLNSFQSVERAVAAEAARQVEALQRGEIILQETRRFDPKTGRTYAMRRKETSQDYRFFPDPDLKEICLTQADLDALRTDMPLLPDVWQERCRKAYGVSAYAAEQLTAERWLAEYFEQAASRAKNPTAVANLLLGEVFAQLALRDTAYTGQRDRDSLLIAPEHLAALSDMLTQGQVNSSTGKAILGAMFQQDCDPQAYAQAHDLLMLTDEMALCAATRQALAENPGMVETYRKGKTNVERALMGKAMALTGGKAEPERLLALLRKALAEPSGDM